MLLAASSYLSTAFMLRVFIIVRVRARYGTYGQLTIFLVDRVSVNRRGDGYYCEAVSEQRAARCAAATGVLLGRGLSRAS
jgi:hypothetical protein